MKTIWLINQYATTAQTGIGGRHLYLARELANRGHRVYLIAARWHHLLRDADGSEAAPVIEEIDGFNFVRIPTPRYRHAHDKKRTLNWLLFTWRLSQLHRVIPSRPDAILYSSPAPFGFLGAERLARRFGARLVFEVRDIWPLTLVELGGHSARHPLIRMMQWVEDRAYRKADRVVSNLPGAVEHMVARGMERGKFSWIPNGFSKSDAVAPTDLPECSKDQPPRDRFVVGYAGTLGLANALDNLLAAAERLRDRTDIAFVLVGNGREKDRLHAATRARGLENVHFIEAVPKGMVQAMLESFDVCYIGWLNLPLYRYGISANKIFDYLYSGRPIVHAFSGAYDPVEVYGAGVTVPAEDPSALAEAILKLRDLPPEQRRRMGENGRREALEHHEYGMLTNSLENVLFGELGGIVDDLIEHCVGVGGVTEAVRTGGIRTGHLDLAIPRSARPRPGRSPTRG